VLNLETCQSLVPDTFKQALNTPDLISGETSELVRTALETPRLTKLN
jgi:hypothetical protein